MIDVGDVYELAVSNEDLAIDPDNTTAPTLTITLPDQTVVTPPVTTGPTSGTWSSIYLTTQAGRHVARWARITSVGGFSQTDVFNVAHGDEMLISLEGAKSYLSLKGTTRFDEDLREFVAGVTAVVEEIVGPVVTRVCDETYDGGSPTIGLLNNPVLSITSVTESYGSTYTRTLTAQVLDSGQPVDAYGYTIDLESGTLTRRVSGVAAAFPLGRRNVHVVYRAGRAAVPYNVLQAAKDLMRINWQPQNAGSGPGYVGPGGIDSDAGQDQGEMILGFFVPERVSQQLLPSRHSWGIA